MYRVGYIGGEEREYRVERAGHGRAEYQYSQAIQLFSITILLAMQNLARWRSLTFVFNNSKWHPAKLCLRLRSISRPQHLIRKL